MGAFLLFYVTEQLRKFLSALPDNSHGVIQHGILYRQEATWLVYLLSATPAGGEKWEDVSLPIGFQKESAREGLFYKTNLSAHDVGEIKSLADLNRILERAVPGGLPKSHLNEGRPIHILLSTADAGIHLLLLLDPEKGNIYRVRSLESSNGTQGQRLPPEVIGKRNDRVGIVGLGSVGSKIAVSLARTGIGAFVFSDDDVFLPENVCRNALDWRSLGEHKVNAVAQTIEFLRDSVTIDAHSHSITGQESTATVNHILDRLAECNLLIDATANPTAFNILSSIAVSQSIPLVWMEVFPGGIGGMVARYRPGLDPNPKTMRWAYLKYAEEHPFPNVAVPGRYAAETTDGEVIVATDADVSIIADYATELAIDALFRPNASAFPYSMYLVGLRKFWVFRAPFHVIQLPTEHLINTSEAEKTPAEGTEAGREFLLGILQRLGSGKATE